MKAIAVVKKTTVDGKEVAHTNVSAHFDGMSWPTVGKKPMELQWRFRYAPKSITESDLLYAASIISAYRALIVNKTSKERAEIVKILKHLDDTTEEWHPSDGS